MDIDFEKGLEPIMGDSKMDDTKPENLVDTTDCLEAIGVFRGWKNFLFIVVLCCLLVLAVLFWAVDLGVIKPELAGKADAAAADVTASVEPPPTEAPKDVILEVPPDVNRIEAAAKEVAGEQPPISPGDEQPAKKPRVVSAVKYRHVAWLIRFVDFVLCLAAMLYCLTMLFSLLISLLGRLGGINHIARGFVLSVVFVVLLLPWQKLFGSAVKGAMYTPAELAEWFNWIAGEQAGIFTAALYYLRFAGYWLLVVLVLIFSMVRSIRWTKATLRRLEVI